MLKHPTPKYLVSKATTLPTNDKFLTWWLLSKIKGKENSIQL